MNYGKEVDMWAIGCIMGEITDGDPLFPGESEIDQLYLIQKIMGELTPEQEEEFRKNPRFIGLSFPDVSKPETLQKHYIGKMSKKAISLMDGFLEMDPTKRITALEALAHPYFDGIRDEETNSLIRTYMKRSRGSNSSSRIDGRSKALKRKSSTEKRNSNSKPNKHSSPYKNQNTPSIYGSKTGLAPSKKNLPYGENLSSKLLKKESKDSIPVNGKDINTFEKANMNMFEKGHTTKVPGQEEYEYEIDADFEPDSHLKHKVNPGKVTASEETRPTAFSHVVVQSEERSPSLSPSNKDDKAKANKLFNPYNQLTEAQKKSRKTGKLGEDMHYGFFGGGSTGDTGGLDIEHHRQMHREEEKSASIPKKGKKSKKKNKVIAKDSKKEFQILMQSKKQAKKQSFVNQNEMSIIDFHKNNEMHQNHEYNYDIPFSNDMGAREENQETPKEAFMAQKGQFSFKSGGQGANKKHYMKFT